MPACVFGFGRKVASGRGAREEMQCFAKVQIVLPEGGVMIGWVNSAQWMQIQNAAAASLIKFHELRQELGNPCGL
jgi:hypothetical protein